MPLSLWSRSSISAKVQVLLCLSYAASAVVLSLGQTTDLHCGQLVSSPVSGTISYRLTCWVDLDQTHHLIFFGTVDGPLLLAPSPAYTVQVWWDCTLWVRALLVTAIPFSYSLVLPAGAALLLLLLSHAGGNKSQRSQAAAHGSDKMWGGQLNTGIW